MSIRVHVGGQIVPPEAARISVFDRGFLYGDTVFETVATAGGRLFALGEHLARLQESARRIGIVAPPADEIERAVRATVDAAGNAESRVRIMLSRGEGWGDLDPASVSGPSLVVIAGPRGGPTSQMYVDGVRVVLSTVARNDPRALDPAVKSGNYLSSVLAVGEARRKGAHEAILCATSGSVAEGASSNVFIVSGNRVRTPGLSVGILAGVTRRHVLHLCRVQRIDCEEVDFLSPAELRAADEVFLTSAVRGVLPVTAVDGQPVGDGRPGPFTIRIMELYRQLTEDTAV